MVRRSPAKSLAPNWRAMRTEKPWASPWTMESIIQLNQSTAPSAASAPRPRTLPTMAVSATV